MSSPNATLDEWLATPDSRAAIHDLPSYKQRGINPAVLSETLAGRGARYMFYAYEVPIQQGSQGVA